MSCLRAAVAMSLILVARSILFYSIQLARANLNWHSDSHITRWRLFNHFQSLAVWAFTLLHRNMFHRCLFLTATREDGIMKTMRHLWSSPPPTYSIRIANKNWLTYVHSFSLKIEGKTHEHKHTYTISHRVPGYLGSCEIILSSAKRIICMRRSLNPLPVHRSSWRHEEAVIRWLASLARGTHETPYCPDVGGLQLQHI